MHPILSIQDMESVIEKSRSGPVFIFKHSTACPISHAAHREVVTYCTGKRPEDPEVYIVRVIEERPVSIAIAERLGVAHKSPQIILVSQGKPLWQASHHGIHEHRLRETAGGQFDTSTVES